MKYAYNGKDKLVLFLLATGIFCFGVILPDSLSNHVKLVHFSAHFGMSFLLALCFYMLCTVKLRISKSLSYTILIIATLFIGVIYKYWEIATQGMFTKFSFSTTMELTGTATSMSQNISGLLAAMFLIEGLVHRNLIISLLRSGHLPIEQIGLHADNLVNSQLGDLQGKNQAMSMPVGNRFSTTSSEN